MSGETGASISGWTTDTLHEHFQKQLVDLADRLQERFDTQTKESISAAAKAEKAVFDALAAADKEALKAEAAADKRFDSVNEFRQTLTDQAAHFIPRAEAEQRIATNSDKVAALAVRLAALEARVQDMPTREERTVLYNGLIERDAGLGRQITALGSRLDLNQGNDAGERALLAGQQAARSDSRGGNQVLIGALSLVIAVLVLILGVVTFYAQSKP